MSRRKLYECEDCGSLFQLTPIDTEDLDGKPDFCPYCAEKALSVVDED